MMPRIASFGRPTPLVSAFHCPELSSYLVPRSGPTRPWVHIPTCHWRAEGIILNSQRTQTGCARLRAIDMDQQITFSYTPIVVVDDNGASHAVLLAETDDTALNACLWKVRVHERGDVIAVAVAIGGVSA